MRHLSREQLRVLETLSGVWPEARLVLIGAAGLGFSVDMSWRATQDLDLAVTIDLDESTFPTRATTLLARYGRCGIVWLGVGFSGTCPRNTSAATAL